MGEHAATNGHVQTLIEKPTFRIEDNILIGKEIEIYRDPVNIAEIVLKTLKSKPDFIGQIDGITGKVNTFADMSERSIKCALWLKKQGVKQGDVISLCTDNNLDAIIIMLGTMYVGAISNTWDHILSPVTAQYFLSLMKPSIVFTIARSAASVTEAAKELKMDIKVVVLEKLDGYESLENILRDHDTREIVEFKCVTPNSPDDVCLIVPSSGTTGMPKGTMISHSSLRNSNHPQRVSDMKDHISIFTPTLRWHYGVLMSFKAIMAYSTRIVVPDYDNAVAMCEFIEKYRVSFFASDPYLLIKFLKNGLLEKYRLPTLKRIITTGAHFKKEYQEAFARILPNVFIANNYGSTDSAAACCNQVEGYSKMGSIGFVATSAQMKVVDLKTEKGLGANKIGELRAKLPTVMIGYYNNPEATKQAFDSDGWLRTGDLGYYDDDGEIFIVDRISDFINFRSINVSPGEVENVLGTHPAVLQAAVIGIPHEVDEQHLMAIIVRVSGKTVTEEELINLVEKNMPDHCRLRGGVKFLDDLPRTPTGKVAKKKLREMFALKCAH